MSVRIYAKEECGLTPYQVMQREDILNTLASDATDKALSVAQGKALSAALAGKQNAINASNAAETRSKLGLASGALKEIQRGIVTIDAVANGGASAEFPFRQPSRDIQSLS